jgi:hypothetical protein
MSIINPYKYELPTSGDFYGNAQSLSGGTPQILLGSISANSQQQFHNYN